MDESVYPAKTEQSPFTILTLGDGDFSWSVDLAKHLAGRGPHLLPLKLIATGIDSLDELKIKYHNVNCWLKELVLYGSEATGFSVDICHEVNAVEDKKDSIHSAVVSKRSDLVIFHHPHLGTEDAKRHASFLCHLFHTVRERWIRDLSTGHFYLTLAQGQHQRWNCQEAAEKNGFILRGCWRFLATAVTNGRYEHRRHQTGKSFRSRTVGSYTWHYVHSTNKHHLNHHLMPLPWFHETTKPDPDSTVPQPNDDGEALDNPFACPHCERSFKEARFLQQHIVAKHSNALSANSERNLPPSFTCESCSRTFASKTSLEDHRRAKHTGLHLRILPEWSAAERCKGTTTNSITTTSPHQRLCPICSAPEHDATWLLPPSSVASGVNDKLMCCFCGKNTFASLRALQQHENFCKKRLV